MRILGLACVLTTLGLACDVVRPTSVTGPVANGVSPEVVLSSAVAVLSQEGYTVIESDPTGGYVTTDWRAESSFASQNFLGISRRKRVSVVFDLVTGQLSVQMTKQKREGEAPWRNDGLSNEDRRQMDVILSRIQVRLSLLASPGEQPVS